MNLDKLFYPQSIAIVGASTKEGSVGNDLAKNLATQGYEGKIYPVNPKAEELYGLKVYPSMTAVGAPIDLALIAIPAVFVPDVLREAGELGVKAAVVISAGFKEVGNVDLENQIKDICNQYDIALVGPNCLGIINPEINMNSSFAALMPGEGNVAFISQSGALCTAVIDYAAKMGIGFSKFMSVGNKAVLSELQIIEYLNDDPRTKVIAMYVEGLVSSSELIDMVQKNNRSQNPKPIVVLKSGRTSAGASASASHTGALAGSDAAYDALFNQAGILRAQSVSQLFNYTEAFMNNSLPQGKRTAIITNAGGPGVLATDEAISFGLELAKLSDSTIASLKSFLPEAANVHNPVDVLGDAKADRYEQTLRAVAADPNVDNVMVILTPQSMTEIEATATAIVNAKNGASSAPRVDQKKTPEVKDVQTSGVEEAVVETPGVKEVPTPGVESVDKPIIVSFMGETTVKPGVDIMQAGGVATCSFPEQCARSMAALANYAEFTRQEEPEGFSFDNIDREKVKNIFESAKNEGRTSFPEAEAMEIMRAYNFPLLKSQVVRSADEANEIAPSIGARLAMKIVSKDILHKSDVGGVMIDVDPAEAGAKYSEMMQRVSERMPEANLEGVLLMEMAPKGGYEFIVGSSKDPSLGSMVMVGLGGIYVEVLKDVAFGLVPITKADARRMIKSLRSSKIFDGVRGGEPLDVEALVDCLGRLSQLLTDFPEIKEVDLNPVLVYQTGVKALDARVVIE